MCTYLIFRTILIVVFIIINSFHGTIIDLWISFIQIVRATMSEFMSEYIFFIVEQQRLSTYS